MAGDQVVDSVAEKRRDEIAERGKTPDATEVTRNAKTGGRADEDALRSVGVAIDPHHRVDVHEIGMTRAHGAPEIALQRGEAQGVLALMAEHELNGGGAEPAGAIVEQHGTRTRCT